MDTHRLVQVVIIDDMTDTRTMLAEILDETPGVAVVGSAPDQRSASALVKENQPDLVVLDLDFSVGMSGIELLPRIVEDCPTARVVALSAHGTDHERAALDAGASVYFVKRSVREVVEDLRAVIDDVRAGRLN